jgi:glyoxylase-like metal-dependent hydrolase (beta-lactamase superfamily II)
VTVQQVAEGTYRLRDGLVNCYLLQEDGDVTLVDAAWPWSWSTVQRGLSEIGYAGRVTAVLLTHGHPDHVGCAEKARASWKVPVLAYQGEVARVTGKAKGSSPWGLVPDLLPLMWRPKVLGFVLHASAHGFMTPRWVKEVTGFEEEAELDLPGHPKPILTPGHTQGHCSFHLPDRGVFIAGDALATLDPLTHERGPKVLPDPLNVDRAQALSSLGKLTGVDADVILSGHGEPYYGSLAGAVETAMATH